MSQAQRAALDQMLRQAPLELGGDPQEQRAIFARMQTAIPLAADVVTTPGTLGGVPVVAVDLMGVAPDDAILYLHGGAYAIGSAAESVGLAAARSWARRTGGTPGPPRPAARQTRSTASPVRVRACVKSWEPAGRS